MGNDADERRLAGRQEGRGKKPLEQPAATVDSKKPPREKVLIPYIRIGEAISCNIDLCYKGWGHGQPVAFSHGCPPSPDTFEDEMLFLASHMARNV